MTTQQMYHSWVRGPYQSTFAAPVGFTGKLAGRVMAKANLRDQQQVLDVLDVPPGGRVLEIGYGPGALTQLLVRHTGAALVAGADRSPTMRDLARRRNAGAVRDGRVDLRVGTADSPGFESRSFDVVVSVNNVACWADLEAGLLGLHGALRPGGQAVVAWHSATARTDAARKLALTDAKLDELETTMSGLFDTVRREELPDLVVFIGRR